MKGIFYLYLLWPIRKKGIFAIVAYCSQQYIRWLAWQKHCAYVQTGDKIRENEQCESALRTNGSATNATPSQWKFLGVEQIESHYEDFKKKSLFDAIFSNNFSENI